MIAISVAATENSASRRDQIGELGIRFVGEPAARHGFRVLRGEVLLSMIDPKTGPFGVS